MVLLLKYQQTKILANDLKIGDMSVLPRIDEIAEKSTHSSLITGVAEEIDVNNLSPGKIKIVLTRLI